jgi:hypothetical protein
MKPLKIAHVTTYGPNQSGLYEASRNMMKADFLAGNIPYAVDTGIKSDATYHEPKVGAVDNRGEFSIETQNKDILNNVDVIVMHTYCPEAWLVKNQAPIVWIMHGRPAAAFRQEVEHEDMTAYTAYGNVSHWPRVKKMIHFWPEYEPYWDLMIEQGKQEIFEYPAIDEVRFSSEGDKWEIKPENLGTINGLICDPRRDDIDRFDLIVGAYTASKAMPGLKWHFFGLDTPIKKVEERMLWELQRIGGLGTYLGRVHTMERVYRAFDFLYTPHRIITQIVGEAVACGIKVIAQNGNKLAAKTIDVTNPGELIQAIASLKMCENVRLPTLREFGAKMDQIYKKVVLM